MRLLKAFLSLLIYIEPKHERYNVVSEEPSHYVIDCAIGLPIKVAAFTNIEEAKRYAATLNGLIIKKEYSKKWKI